MNQEIRFSPTELELIEQLLAQERDELPHEIHHTRLTSMKVELQQRLETVRTILQRLRVPASTSA